MCFLTVSIIMNVHLWITMDNDAMSIYVLFHLGFVFLFVLSRYEGMEVLGCTDMFN